MRAGYVLSDDGVFPIIELIGADGDDGEGSGDDESGAGESKDSSGDEGQESSSKGEGKGEGADDDEGEDEGDGEGDGEGEEDKPRTYNARYVKRLRREAAQHRKEKQTAQARLKELDDAEKSDVDKAKEEATESKTQATTSKERLRAREMDFAVTQEAVKLKFHDGEDAAALLDTTDIEVDEETGVPNREDIVDALKDLAKSKPHLVSDRKKVVAEGDGDGGKTGKSPKPKSHEQQIDDQEKKLIEKEGYVKLPV